jgi:hypothetical protein
MPETLEQKRPVKFFGRFWSDEHGVVGAREAALMAAIIRTAWRKDFDGKGVSEGFLSSWIHKTKTDEMWKIAIHRIVNWKLAELVPAYSGDAVRVKLTGIGKKFAVDLCCELQRRGKPVDGTEDLAKELEG